MRVMLDIYDDIVPPDEKDADKPKEEEEGDDVDAVEKEKKQKLTPPVLSVEDALKSEIELKPATAGKSRMDKNSPPPPMS